MRKVAAITFIPIALLIETTVGAITVVVIISRARTQITSLRKIAAVAVIPIAFCIEAAAAARTIAICG